MARFDIFRNSGVHADTTPYFLDVQSNLLDGLNSCVVIPLRQVDRFASVKLPLTLTPVFEVEGRHCMLETPKLAAVPRSLLKDVVASLASERSRITGALDFLFQGY